MAAQTIRMNMTASKARRTSVWLEFYARGAEMTGRIPSNDGLCLATVPGTSNTSAMLAQFIYEQLLNKHMTDNNTPSTSL